MRILFNNLNQKVGQQTGTTRYGFALLQRLIARGTHDYLLLSPFTRDQLPDTLQSATLEVITRRPHRSHLVGVLRQAIDMPRLARNKGVDIVLNVEAVGSPCGGRRRITIAHDFIHQQMAGSMSVKERLVSRALLSLVLGGSDDVVAISQATLADMRRFFPSTARKAVVIPNASTFDVPLSRPMPAPDVPFRYVLAVGNATPNKNFGVLADAMARINPALGLGIVHVGVDPAETIRTRLTSVDAAVPLVRMAGVPDDTVATLFRHAVCLVAPSILEGFCLPVLEAQAQGCPTIFSRTSATGEIGGDGGIAFDPLDPDALARHIAAVFTDEALRVEMIARGHRNASRYNWDRTLDAFEALFARGLLQPARLAEASR